MTTGLKAAVTPITRGQLNSYSTEIADEKRPTKGRSVKAWNHLIDTDLKNPKCADGMPPRTRSLMRKYVLMDVSLTARWVYDVALYQLRFNKPAKTTNRSKKPKGGSLITSEVYLTTNYLKAWGVSERAAVEARKELIAKGFLEEIREYNYWGSAKKYKVLVLPWGLK